MGDPVIFLVFKSKLHSRISLNSEYQRGNVFCQASGGAIYPLFFCRVRADIRVVSDGVIQASIICCLFGSGGHNIKFTVTSGSCPNRSYYAN